MSAPPSTVRLRVIGGSVELRDDVPRTRAACPTARDARGNRICGHIKCEWHLWLVDRRDRPGRFRDGLTSELRPVWLEWPLPPSCGADAIQAYEDGETVEGESVPIDRIAELYGLSRRGVNYLLGKAKAKLREGATLPDGSDDTI